MSSTTCQHVMTYGPNQGTPCGQPVFKDSLCERCDARKSLLEQTQLSNVMDKCKSTSDPYNQQPCEREAVFRNYCLVCLSGH